MRQNSATVFQRLCTAIRAPRVQPSTPRGRGDLVTVTPHRFERLGIRDRCALEEILHLTRPLGAAAFSPRLTVLDHMLQKRPSTVPAGLNTDR